MSISAAPDDVISDAALALGLFIRNPAAFRGIVLRGDGPARDAMLDYAKAAIARHGPVVKIPANVDAERLLGGLDLTATLAAGRGVMRPGLLDAAAGGVVILPMAERLNAGFAAHIAAALDGGDVAAILLDDSREEEDGPPKVLTERIAFHADVAAIRHFVPFEGDDALPLSAVEPLTDEQLHALAVTAAALGIDSVRPLLFAQMAVRGHAALLGRTSATEQDLTAAVRLVLAPRATQMPEAAPPEQEPPPPEPDMPDESEPSDGQDDERTMENIDLDDIMLEAAVAAIPRHILDHIDGRTRGLGKGQSGRAGEKQKSAQRGRPMGPRPGIPGHGRKLALIDSLRAAAPWQSLRRSAAPLTDTRTVHIRKSDLRIRHFEQRKESLTIFAVDASGSSALSRLAEAKGAVEMMLAQAYVKRSQVALIAFRHHGAEVLLPPTRSLTRARRALSALPGGGGTPLAAGLIAARSLAEGAVRGGQTPTLAILTDGKANVAMDGTANRALAAEETQQAAASIRMAGYHSIVIDISPRPREEAAALADALGGRYLPLPQARSAAMVAAIESVSQI